MKKYILLILTISLLAFTFTGGPSGGWYQQFLPDVGGMPISDIEFLDSLTGFFVTDNDSGPDTGYIAKTTNGGDNWSIVFKDRRDFSRILFLNNSTGYVCGGTGTGTPYIYKTTNQGDNWFVVPSPDQTYWDDMSVLNEDTIWVVDKNSFNGGIFRTTNGGMNWTQQYFDSGTKPISIYMVNGQKGYFTNGVSPSSKLFKTTNSGLNWNIVVGENGFTQMYFIDSLTGWKARGEMKKTTDGGQTWNSQELPFGGIISISAIEKFVNLNRDTIWAVGSRTSNQGLVYKTTNGGLNWGYQFPDTAINIFKYSYVDFTSNLHGWAYSTVQGGVHTKVGGDDTTIYVGVNQVNSEVPTEFKLHQNYPNPFNPTTGIKFKVKSLNLVRLSVYDITGKEVSILVNEKLQAGEYEYRFDGTELSSGVYFYRLQAGEYVEAKRMVLIK